MRDISSHNGQVIDGHLMIYQIFQGTCIKYDLYDLYDLAHVAGWEPYNLHDPGHVPWVGSVLQRSCTTAG